MSLVATAARPPPSFRVGPASQVGIVLTLSVRACAVRKACGSPSNEKMGIMSRVIVAWLFWTVVFVALPGFAQEPADPSISRNIRDLTDKDPQVREYAAMNLANRGSTEKEKTARQQLQLAVPALTAAFRTKIPMSGAMPLVRLHSLRNVKSRRSRPWSLCCGTRKQMFGRVRRKILAS